jgi:hypothetical protein
MTFCSFEERSNVSKVFGVPHSFFNVESEGETGGSTGDGFFKGVRRVVGCFKFVCVFLDYFFGEKGKLLEVME